jgi:hypothetical protein
MNRSILKAAGAVVLLAIGLAGCSGDSSTSPKIDPVGSWSGTTSQALPFSFQVTSAGLTTVTMSYRLTGSRCSYSADASVSGTPLPVTNNVISISGLPVGTGSTLSASGSFTSSSAASGSFQISDSYCGGSTSGTWTATKH